MVVLWSLLWEDKRLATRDYRRFSSPQRLLNHSREPYEIRIAREQDFRAQARWTPPSRAERPAHSRTDWRRYDRADAIGAPRAPYGLPATLVQHRVVGEGETAQSTHALAAAAATTARLAPIDAPARPTAPGISRGLPAIKDRGKDSPCHASSCSDRQARSRRKFNGERMDPASASPAQHPSNRLCSALASALGSLRGRAGLGFHEQPSAAAVAARNVTTRPPRRRRLRPTTTRRTTPRPTPTPGAPRPTPEASSPTLRRPPRPLRS